MNVFLHVCNHIQKALDPEWEVQMTVHHKADAGSLAREPHAPKYQVTSPAICLLCFLFSFSSKNSFSILFCFHISIEYVIFNVSLEIIILTFNL